MSVRTSKKQVMKDRIRRHQPCGGGYGVDLECTCGATFDAAHQIQMVLDGYAAESESEATASERYWAS